MDKVKIKTDLVESYLTELCKVNDIEESELQNYVQVKACIEDEAILVINADDDRDVKFGVTTKGDSLQIFGEITDREEEFQETVKLSELCAEMLERSNSTKDGGVTGNTGIAP